MSIQSIDLLTLSPTVVVALGALVALVAELVTGDARLYLVSAVAVAAQVSLFPSEARWKGFAVQPLASGGPGRMDP